MNSLDDLRRTLDAHAHDTNNPGGVGGVDRAALHSRISDARRRRAATRGGVALAAVVAVASVAFLPGMLSGTEQGPASREERTVLGQVAPASKKALGLTYAWDSVATAEDETSISLEPDLDEQAPLLTWTTVDPDARVTVTDADGTLLWTSRTDGFADHLVLDQYPELPVTVTSDEPGLAVATYTFDEDEPVAGFTGGGLIFPQEVGDRRLVAAAVSEPGETEVSVDVPAEDVRGAAHISFTAVCVGFEQDAGTALETDGEPLSWGGLCNREPGVVRSPGNGYDLSEEAPAPRTASARAATMDESLDMTDEPVDEPKGRIGLAVYVQDLPDVEFHGMTQQRTQEWGGHRWELAASANGTETSTADDLDPATQWLARAIAVLPPGGFLDDDPDLSIAADGKELGAGASQFSTKAAGGRAGVATGSVLLPLGTRSATVPEVHASTYDQYQLLAWKLVD